MLQAQCEGKTKHKYVVEAMRWQVLVRATAGRLDKLVVSAMRGYAVVWRTPCSLQYLLREMFTRRPCGGNSSEVLSVKAMRELAVVRRIFLSVDILFTTPCENKL